MPTAGRGTISAPLTPQQTLEQVSGLIEEIPDDQPATPEPAAAPEVPASEPAPQPPDQPETPELTDDDAQMEEVVVNGAPVQVTKGELRRNYSQHAHNTQRAQELAAKEKLLEPSIRQRVESEYAEKVTAHSQELTQIRAALEKINGEPNWVELGKTLEPSEFLKQKRDWEVSRAELDQLKRHEQEVAEEAAQAQARAFQTYRRAEQDKLLAAVPEWADSEKAKAEQAKLVSVAKQYGFSEQEVLGVTDHRAILLLRDAMRYRELHREPTRPKPKTSDIKTARPGTPDRPRPNAEYTKKVERAKQSGRQRDAMDAIADLID